jgi:hypothetical protein
MEKGGDRQKKMEGHRSTGQSSHRAVVPVEEEEDQTSWVWADTTCSYFYCETETL